ncbi:chemotaxis protein methyltransferase CheR [Cohaesibacter sp. ES.047]|uniref:CheR family methyltransferase n=1 Tax=Cohaesibacter sp. ES.047 TaxID=1798205 RepID=UPI000BB89DD2|nr:protein-glutamate O-methyltransferase CheR [Cohaesibacter sp. ES.047]SNY91104.1 chemotaxis protein methyltransferase CheR [Cohaesibacter sp. ES.047]
MTPQDYAFLQGFLKEKSGLVLSNDKQYLVESRLMPIARKANLSSIADLIGKLRGLGDRTLQTAVVEAMTTNESFFFRDKTPFEHFADTILPHLVATRKTGRVRIWCAAASTGQEPYSLAMSLKENASKLRGLSFEIIGTDISQEVLEKARSGFYSQFEVQRGLPVQMLIKYFKQVGEMWQIAPEIRSMVTYRPFNLLESFASMGQFDVIFCRNVLIYFDQATKSDIMNRLSKQLAGDGYLLLGAAETVVGLTTSFQNVQGKRGLYVNARGATQTASAPQTPRAVVGGASPTRSSLDTGVGSSSVKPLGHSRFSSIPGGRR